MLSRPQKLQRTAPSLATSVNEITVVWTIWPGIIVHTLVKNLSVVQLVARLLLGLTCLNAILPVTTVIGEIRRGIIHRRSWHVLRKPA